MSESEAFDRINDRLARPASAGEMALLRAHILTALEARETLKIAQPDLLPLHDLMVLGIALARWLGRDAEEVIAALRAERIAQP